jgi:glucose/arabinose dehydrogenase
VGVHRSVALVVAAVLALAFTAASAQAALKERLVHAASFPAAFAFDPDGRIFYGERLTGRIRIFDPASGQDKLFATLPNIVTSGEQGLLGLAIDPNYPGKPFVYAYYTRRKTQTRNVIVRLTDRRGNGKNLKTLVKIPAGGIHNGGVIHFGPDGYLYAVVGENGNRALAQDLSSLAGKVLRMTTLGKAPADNPFPGSLVWSYGLRNSFGFAFDPVTDELWEGENGPECNDELNRIVKGGNFAWGPTATCAGLPPENTNRDGPQPRIMPLAWYTPTIAPTGVTFCEGCGIPSLAGKLVFGDYNRGGIHAVTLTPNRMDIQSQAVVLDRSSAVLAMERAPDSRIFFSDFSGIYELYDG